MEWLGTTYEYIGCNGMEINKSQKKKMHLKKQENKNYDKANWSISWGEKLYFFLLAQKSIEFCERVHLT